MFYWGFEEQYFLLHFLEFWWLLKDPLLCYDVNFGMDLIQYGVFRFNTFREQYWKVNRSRGRLIALQCMLRKFLIFCWDVSETLHDNIQFWSNQYCRTHFRNLATDDQRASTLNSLVLCYIIVRICTYIYTIGIQVPNKKYTS